MDHRARVRIARDAAREALRHPRVLAAVAASFAGAARGNIEKGRGVQGEFEPLHAPPGSPRFGGQPLRDTGSLLNSITAKGEPSGNRGIRINVIGRPYGQWHNEGFSTRGPNYIPLTMKGKRGYSPENLRSGDLVRGVDYIIMRHGVTVHARPFIVPRSRDLYRIGETMFRGLASLLTTGA